MGAAAELFVKVSADVNGLTSGMGQAAKAVESMAKPVKEWPVQVVKPMDEASAAAQKMGAGINTAAGHWVDAAGKVRDASGKFVAGANSAGGAITSLGDLIKGTAGGQLLADSIKGAGSAMLELGARSLKLAGELEQNKVAFTTMLGSAEKADKMLKDLATFAANTPFELRGLTDISKKLMAFGFDAKSIIPIMTSVGDAVGGLGGGQEKIDRITTALGQMAAKGKVSAEEMGQLTEAGIKGWDHLAKAIGVSTPQAMKLAEKGAIDAATAIPALLEGMSKQFGGMMKKQSQTWNGALSNLQDATDQAMTKIGDYFINAFDLTDMVKNISTAIGNLGAAFESGRIIPLLDAMKAGVIGVAVAMTTYLMPGARAAGASMVTAFMSGAAAAAPFIALAAAVAFAAYPIISNWQEIKIGLADVFNAGIQYATRFYNWGIGVAKDFANAFRSATSYVAGLFRSVFGDELTNKLTGGLKSAGAAFDGFAAKVGPAVGRLESWLLGDGRTAAGNFAETWGDAMNSAKTVIGGLFTQTATVAPEVKNITKELLGLKAAGPTAEDAKKKADELAKAQRKAAAEAKRHAHEMLMAEQATQKAMMAYAKKTDVLWNLGKAFKQANIDAKQQGESFDLAGAKAEAIARNMSKAKAAFGEFSPVVRHLQKEMDALKKTSDEFSSTKIVLTGKSDFEKAQSLAFALGKEFDYTAEAVKNAEKVLTDLHEKGVKPGTKLYDEQIEKVRQLQEAQRAAMPGKIAAEAAQDLADQAASAKALGQEYDAMAASIKSAEDVVNKLFKEGFREGNAEMDKAIKKLAELKIKAELAKDPWMKLGGAIGEITGPVNAIGSAILDVAKLFGLDLDESIGKAFKGMMSFAGSIGSVVAAIPGLIAGIASVTAAIATNPIGAILAGIGLAIVGGIALWQWYSKSAQEALEKAKQKALDLADAQVAISDALLSSNLQERLAQKQREESFKQITEMVGRFSSETTSAVKKATLAFMAGSADWASDLRENLKRAMFESLLDKAIFDMLGATIGQRWVEVGDKIRNGQTAAAGELAQNIVNDAVQMIGPITGAAEMLMKAFGMAPGEITRLAQESITKTKQAVNIAEQHASTLSNIYKKIEQGQDEATTNRLLAQARILQGRASAADEVASRGISAGGYRLQPLATGGLVTGPTFARMGEGGRNEAVLPLNENVYRQIGQGIASARGGGTETQVVVQYYGSGKWTREDAQGLGRLLVSELRAMGVR